MCQSILIPCDKTHDSGGDLLAALVAAWAVAKVAYRLAGDFAVGLVVLAIALFRVARWTARTVRRGYRWYVTLPVNRGQRPPVAAIADKPADVAAAMTLADLRLKEPANR